MSRSFTLLFAMLVGAVPSLSGAIIGTNSPAQPLTAKRVASLPADQQSAWEEYLARSRAQLEADQAFLHAEMKEHNLSNSIPAPAARTFGGLPLGKPAVWYASDEGRRIADIIVSFQTPAGGWSKRLDMTHHLRAPGERFDGDTGSRYLTNADNDLPHEGNWSYVGTFDNAATTTQLRYLGKVASAVPGQSGASYRAAFLRGLDYIFAAQYPNGGWPQVWPLAGGYHDAITYNDGAMINVLELLRDVAAGRDEFAFVPTDTRARSTASLKRGVACILATQIQVNDRRTVWCQQHDVLTLQPTSARNYEMPNQTGSESAGILTFLMSLPEPSPEVLAAVNAAAAWFEKTKILGVAYQNTGLDGRQLVRAPGYGPIWARYYEIGTDRPIFGDRDKTIHDQVNEISKERRKGYAWYNDAPKRALQLHATWRKSHPDGASPENHGPKSKPKPRLKSPRDS